MKEFIFEELEGADFIAAYSDGCTNASASACCTRVCTRPAPGMSEELELAWGEFLEVDGGVVQY